MFYKCRFPAVTVFLFCLAMPAYAENGHCNYNLFSKALGHSLRVCQTAGNRSQCGVLMRKKYDRSRAYAVKKKGGKIKFRKGSCNEEAVVGVCRLPDTSLYFYEGDTEALAEGCDRMKGHWRARRF